MRFLFMMTSMLACHLAMFGDFLNFLAFLVLSILAWLLIASFRDSVGSFVATLFST